MNSRTARVYTDMQLARKRAYMRQRYKHNRAKILAKQRDYYAKNIDKIRANNKIRYKREKAKRDLYAKQYRARNADKLRKYMQRWRHANYKAFREKANAYVAKRCQEDPMFVLVRALRARLRGALATMKGQQKADRTLKLLGCTLHSFKRYIERRFKRGMSWKNRQKWHIDHIKPIAAFDKGDPQWQYVCFHYTNLRPLWARENLEKGSKYNG